MTPDTWFVKGFADLNEKVDFSDFFEQLKNSDIKKSHFAKLHQKYSLENILFLALQMPDKLDGLKKTERKELTHIVRTLYLIKTLDLLILNYHLTKQKNDIFNAINNRNISFQDLNNNCYVLGECGVYFDTLDYMASHLSISANSMERYKSIVLFEFIHMFMQEKHYSLTGDNLQKWIIENKTWLAENSGRISDEDAKQDPILTEKAVAELVKEKKIIMYSWQKDKILSISYADYKKKVANKIYDSDKVYFALDRMFTEETQTLEIIKNFATHPNFISLPEDYVRSVAAHYSATNKEGIKLNESQIEALVKIFNKDAFCGIIGEAGSGKTTLIKAMIAIYKEYVGTWPEGVIQQRLDDVRNKLNKSHPHINQLAVVSYTGRAASSYEKAVQTKENEQDYNFLTYGTIHNVMHFGIDSKTDAKRAIFMIGDFLVVDEASMIDLSLLHRMLNHLSYGVKLVFTGDPNQVAPIHSGQFFYDLIHSEAFKNDIVKLDHVYRQDTESPTYTLIKDILAGNKANPDQYYNTDQVNFCGSKSVESNIHYIKQQVEKHKDNLKQLLILAAKRSGKLGINNLNYIIQQQLQGNNPNFIVNSNGTIFCDGDRVIQIKNDYDQTGANERVMNGEIGTIHISSLPESQSDNIVQSKLSKQVTVTFDDGTVKPILNLFQLNHLELGYAMTVHKAQGIERENVIVALSNLDKDDNTMWSRNLLYTAASRTKKNITFVGSLATYNKAVNIIDNTADKDFIRRFDSMIPISDNNSDDDSDIPDEDLPF